VQQRTELDATDLVDAELHLLGDPARERRHPRRVAAGVGVARVDRRGERAYRGEIELAHARESAGVLEGGRDEIREGLQHRDVLVIEHVRRIGPARENPDKLSATLHRKMNRVRGAEELAGEHDLARRSGSDRNLRLACRGFVPTRFDHEVELVAAIVVARDRKRVAPRQRRGSVERKPRDPERLVHRRELPRQDVQGRQAADPSFALAPLVGRAERARREVRDREQLLSLDGVERSIRIGRSDGESGAKLALEDDRCHHGGVHAHLVGEPADRPVRLDATVGGVIPEEDQLARRDQLPQERTEWHPLVAARRRGPAECCERPAKVALELGDEHPLEVEDRLHRLRDPVDHVLRHRSR